MATVVLAVQLAAQDNASAPLPPITANASAATSLWRRVLSMSDAEREAFIASKPKPWQDCLRAKAQEYLSLPLAEREARLQALELRALMLPLMKMSPAVRVKQLETLPADKRKEVEQRLMTWDILPPPLQAELLQHEATMHRLVDAGTTNLSREQLLAGVLPQQRTQAEKELDSWNSLPQERRDQMMSGFKRYFVEGPQTRSKTIAGLKNDEKAAVAQLEKMPEPQRDRALEGFRKFKDLTPVQQQDFLRAAARWQAMNEGDRQLWRQIAPKLRQNLLPPPFPPPPPASRLTGGKTNR